MSQRARSWMIFGGAVAVAVVFVAVVVLMRDTAPDRVDEPAEPTIADEPAGPRRPWLREDLPPRERFVRTMNIAKAHLENVEHIPAIELLNEAVRLDAESLPAWRNLARAHLVSDNPAGALDALDRAGELGDDSAAVSYLRGVSLMRQGHYERAIPHLERAMRLEPNVPANAYQLALAYDVTGQRERAVEQFHRTVDLDHSHSQAHYELAMAARRAYEDTGREDEDYLQAYRAGIAEFRRLRDLYGERYKTEIAQEACVHTIAEPPFTPGAPGPPAPEQTIEVRFEDATDELLPSEADRIAAAIAPLRLEDDGRYTFFVVRPDGAVDLMRLADEGRFGSEAADLRLADLEGVYDALVAHFGQPATGARLPGVLLIGPAGGRLIAQPARDRFEDITEQSGLGAIRGRAAWVDYDHDGDADLLVANPDGAELWRNDGRARFTLATEEAGLPTGLPAADAAAVDLGLNFLTDLIVASGDGPTRVFENQRAGRFAPMPEPPGPWPAAHLVLADDLLNDGRADTVLIGEGEAVLIFDRGGRRTIDLGDDFHTDAAVLLDYDNSGQLDLLLIGRSPDDPQRSRVRAWRNGGREPWPEVTERLGLDEAPGAPGPPVVHALAIDAEADGDTDLILLTADQTLRVLRNVGGHENGQLKLRLHSTLAEMDNAGGIGTRAQLRDADFVVTRFIRRELPIELGLAGRDTLDTAQTVWPDGIVRNELNVDPAQSPLSIYVVQRDDSGSCPFLYTHDGERFVFITDLIGGGATGLPVSRDQLVPANPHEIAIIGGEQRLRPTDGHFDLIISNELREATYLDHARLIAIDHPPGAEVHSTDKLRPPPFEESRVWALGDPAELVSAAGDDGIDRTSALRAIDGDYAPPGPPVDPPQRGVRQPMSLTLEFDPLDSERPLVLALTGWIEYGTASSNIAVSQNADIAPQWPTLEAQRADGRWVELDVQVGMPAGKDKTILVDLDGKLPPDARRLRLSTSFVLVWDRIALFERHDLSDDSIHQATLAGAELDWHGFSELRQRGPDHPTTPDLYNVSQTPPWPTTLAGWYTRYGEVTELLREIDGRLVLMNSGDALSLRFPAADLPPLPEGMTRTYAIYSVGWNRENDPNNPYGDRVEPLPVDMDPSYTNPPAIPDDDEWRLRYNTRWSPYDLFVPEHQAPAAVSGR